MRLLNIFRGKNATSKALCMVMGKKLYHTHSVEFETYYEEYLEDLGVFKDMYYDVYNEFGFKRLGPFQVLYAYGAHYEHTHYVDWRGEENEKEIESFIQKTFPKVKFEWTATTNLRKTNCSRDLRDGKFIVDLFQAIETGIRKSGYALLFFYTDGDGYDFIPTDIETFNLVTRQMKNYFHGVGSIKI